MDRSSLLPVATSGVSVAAASAAGGVVYVVLTDLYRFTWGQQKYCRDLSCKSVFSPCNPGLYIGGGIALLKEYLGMPILCYAMRSRLCHF